MAPIGNIETAAKPLSALLPPCAWLPWRAIRKPNGKLDKPPALGARSNDPTTWRTLERALKELSTEPSVAGIAFAITAGIIALDFDNCRDPVTGELRDEAQRELERLNSYAYITPSGKGFRVVGLNSKTTPIPGRKRKMLLPGGTELEVFVGPTNHYTTFTHEIIAGYETVREIADETLDYLAGLPEIAEDARPNPDAQRGIKAIRAALKTIPNPARNWDQWCYVGMATWRASGGSDEGLDAWTAWSAKCDAHNDDACLERWRHWFRSPPTRLGFGTLYHLARQANPLFVAPFDDVAGEEAAGPIPDDVDPETGEVKEPTFPATPFDPAKFLTLEPRRWVYGHFLIRRYLSVLGAPGGTGKTAYAMTVGASVALGQPLLGEPVHESGPVWIYNLEDPEDEALRRMQAICLLHSIDPEKLRGRLYLDSGRDRPMVIAVNDNGATVATPIVDLMVAELKARGIRLLVVDPFIKSHKLEENRNEQVDFAASLWNQIADKADCSILLAHHFRKGGVSGEADAFRGASALIDAARAAVSLSTMSEKEADKLGVEDDQRRFHIRMDNAKLNLAPPPAHALWLRLNNVELPNGDRVQATSKWEAPSPWDGIPMLLVVSMLGAIGAGPSPGELYTAKTNAADKARWAGSVVVEMAAKTDGQAKDIIRAWIANGLLSEGTYHSPKSRKDVSCVTVNAAKVAEMRQSASGSSDG